MLTFDPGQPRRNVAVLAIERKPALRIVPGEARQAAVDRTDPTGVGTPTATAKSLSARPDPRGRARSPPEKAAGAPRPSSGTSGRNAPSPWHRPCACCPRPPRVRNRGRCRPSGQACRSRPQRRGGSKSRLVHPLCRCPCWWKTRLALLISIFRCFLAVVLVPSMDSKFLTSLHSCSCFISGSWVHYWTLVGTPAEGPSEIALI